MGDADSNYPIPSSYPSWWMYFVRPLESQKDYHEKFPEEKKDSTSSDPTPPPQHSPVQPLRLSSPSHLITIMQPAPFTHHLAPQPRLILPSSPLPAPPTSPPSKSSDKKEQPKRFRTRQEQDGVDQADMAKLFRRLFAEFIGTFTLVFFVAGVALEFNLTGAGIDRTAAGLNQAGAGLASGLTLVFCVYTMGELSGAHFNPVVTWAFALRGLFPPVWVVAYWLAQFAGSILAGGFLQAFYFNNAQLGTTAVNTHYQWVTGFAYEALLTFFFINVILAMATRGGNVGPQAALADGFALSVCVMLGLSYTGTSVNPFRALGPGIINGYRPDLWVYVAGPFLGGSVSVATVWLLNGPLKSEDFGNAQGKGENPPSDDTKEKDEEEAEKDR